MTTVAILGAGAGGLSSAVELSQAGHAVRLWNRSPGTLEPYRDRVIPHSGVLGDGSVTVRMVTTDMRAAVAGADVVVVCVPAQGHAAVFAALAGLPCAVPVVLNPGHTGGALQLRQIFRARGATLPPTAELSTLTYVARTQPGRGVRVTGRAREVRCGWLPGGEDAFAAAAELFPAAIAVPDVLGSSLSNVNLVLHPPGAILAAAWVEAAGGDFTFYVDAMTPGVARVIDSLDAERRAVASAFGHDLPSLAGEMALIGTVPAALAANGDTATAIRAGEANRTILAPGSLRHRYYLEDFPYAVVPFLALTRIAGREAPLAQALLTVASALLGTRLDCGARDEAALGIQGLGRDDLLRLVRE